MSACECERTDDANLAQSLYLLNSPSIDEKLTASHARAARLAGDSERTHEQRIRELYHWAYAREPVSQELAAAKRYIENGPREEAHESPDARLRHAYEDILWALINTKEFSFNH